VRSAIRTIETSVLETGRLKLLTEAGSKYREGFHVDDLLGGVCWGGSGARLRPRGLNHVFGFVFRSLDMTCGSQIYPLSPAPFVRENPS
jgi:hypothetical protein